MNIVSRCPCGTGNNKWMEAILSTPYPELASEEELAFEEECRLRILDRARDLSLI